MKEKKITKGLRPISFSARRQHFFSQIGSQAENSIAIVPAHSELIRNNDVHFKFRQDTNFYYLTGFEEPDSIAVFRNIGGKKEYILFVRPKDLAQEIWTGYRTGVDAAVSKFGADKAYSVAEFDVQFPKLLHGADRVYYSFFKTLNRNGTELLDQKILRHLDLHRASMGRSGRGLLPVYDSAEILGEMRLFKTPEEIDRLRRAAEISAKVHTETMARTRPGLYEFQIEGLLEFLARDAGCERHGYPAIVAGGENATILHYIENDCELRSGDLLLIDAGFECDFHTADITRTFPIDGKMSQEQETVYKIVLDVQKECLRMAKPGATLAGIHAFAVDALTDAMIALKFLSGDKKKLIDTLAYKRYYPHGTGHLLGMDVHDAGLYQVNGAPRLLEPGMVFTVEPGFYVLRDDSQAPSSYRGIGVRIEDNVVITAEGSDVLTTGVSKEISDMAAIVGSKPWLS